MLKGGSNTTAAISQRSELVEDFSDFMRGFIGKSHKIPPGNRQPDTIGGPGGPNANGRSSERMGKGLGRP